MALSFVKRQKIYGIAKLIAKHSTLKSDYCKIENPSS
jgi:hypothetical protein